VQRRCPSYDLRAATEATDGVGEFGRRRPKLGEVWQGLLNSDRHGQRRFGRTPAARSPGSSDLHRSFIGSRAFGAIVQLRAQRTTSFRQIQKQYRQKGNGLLFLGNPLLFTVFAIKMPFVAIG
jgi:hypothetical protein